jgi:20S proteasome alpha/beta subunit
VTIAAGFRFDGGILICADTQYSGSLKFFDTKIHHHIRSRLGGDNVFYALIAVSGTDGYMQMAESAIADAISELSTDKGHEDIDDRDVHGVIADAMVKLHETHLYKHPHYGYISGPSVNVIVAVWMENLGFPLLYWTNETAVNEVTWPDYALVGSGADIARFAIKPLLEIDAQEENTTLEKAIMLATHTLRIAKR